MPKMDSMVPDCAHEQTDCFYRSKNIVGSGLIATAFMLNADTASNVCIYAAGVSNSNCSDVTEFERERLRLASALKKFSSADGFVYMSTCSITDPAAINTLYVKHKIKMEKLVATHPNYIIARLPQVAGHTPNPHTLLNHLYSKIKRSEKLTVWKNATRNIIDVSDVALIVNQMIKNPNLRRITLNIANKLNHPISEIISMFEKVIGKPAVTEIINAGTAYDINTAEISTIVEQLDLTFDND